MNDFHFFRERLGDLQALPWRFNSCAGDDVGAVETRVVLVEGDASQSHHHAVSGVFAGEERFNMHFVEL